MLMAASPSKNHAGPEQLPPLAAEKHTCVDRALAYSEISIEDAASIIVEQVFANKSPTPTKVTGNASPLGCPARTAQRVGSSVRQCTKAFTASPTPAKSPATGLDQEFGCEQVFP
jgi:hypothetical protein